MEKKRLLPQQEIAIIEELERTKANIHQHAISKPMSEIEIPLTGAEPLPQEHYKVLGDLTFSASAVSEVTKRNLLKMKRNFSTRPLVQERKHAFNIRLNKALISHHKWMVVGNDGAWCRYCKLLYPCQPGQLLTKPWSAYSRKKDINDHIASSYTINLQHKERCLFLKLH